MSTLLYNLLIFWNLACSTAFAMDLNGVPLSRLEAYLKHPSEAEQSSQESLQVVAVDFAPGVEGRVLHIEKIYGRDWIYVHFINGAYRGKRGWFPFRVAGSHIRLYAVEKDQAFQTIDITRAHFARTTAASKGYIDFSITDPANRTQSVDESLYTVDFFGLYPRTNFGLEEPVNFAGMNRLCPIRPAQRNGMPCLPPPGKFRLPKYVLNAIRKSAKKYNVHPAIVAAIIQKESYFDPLSENKYEKKLCLEQGKACPAYRWGQGLAQLGATNAREHGLEWQANMPHISSCKKKHIFNQACFQQLENRCASVKRRTGFSPTYCPAAAIDAVAQHVGDLINRDAWMRVDVKNKKGEWQERIVDASQTMRRTLAEEFRYILGMYNRGKRPLNSIEEHYRQNGKAPDWYDFAWLTERRDSTPSTQMGYMILYKEVINRCHVWQLAGLCGDSLENTLAGDYIFDFPEWKQGPNGRRAIANENELPPEILNDPNMNIDPDLFEKDE